MMPHSPLVACVIRQYGTGLYRTCVSLEKNSVTCLSTHQDEASATEMINRFLDTYQAGEIKTPDDILTFIDSMRAEERPTSLPAISQEREAEEMAA